MKNIPNFEQFLNESNINESLDKHTKAVLKYIEGAVADAKKGNESSYHLGLIGAMNYHSRKIVRNLGVWKDIDKIAYGAPNLKAVEAILKKATMAANATGYVNEAKNTIGLAFKDETDYKDFKIFMDEQPRGAIRKDLGWDSKTKSWSVEVDVNTLEDVWGEGTPGNKKSGWYGGLPDDFESVIIS